MICGRRTIPARCAASLALACLCVAARGDDWPQFLGPNRNGISAETGWVAAWPAEGPPVAWQADVGFGFSAVSVAGGRAYTLGNDGARDTVFCFDAAKGTVLWERSYECPKGGYPGPRATPTVAGGRVYTLSMKGNLFCLDAASGNVLWKTDVRESIKAEVPSWGFAGSPLLEGDLLIVNAGSRGAAFQAGTGAVVWQTGPEAAGYASPVAFPLAGKRWVAIFAAAEIAVNDLPTGTKMWARPWETTFDVNAATPLVLGDTMFVSSDYGTGCALLKIGGGVVWQNKKMRNHFGTCIPWDGCLFGFDMSTLRCIDVRTGESRWEHDGLGKGSLIAADGKLIVLSESGELLVAPISPNEFRPAARARVIEGLCWTNPVLSGGRIYCRANEGRLVCLDVGGGRSPEASGGGGG